MYSYHDGMVFQDEKPIAEPTGYSDLGEIFLKNAIELMNKKEKQTKKGNPISEHTTQHNFINREGC